MDFNYFIGNQADEFTFIRIPKVIFDRKEFESLSIQAKVLYGLLIDHMSLAYKNKWLDENSRVYLIYQISEIQEDMNVTKKKAIQYLAELESFGLIEKKTRGLGLPNLIYVKKIKYDPELKTI